MSTVLVFAYGSNLCLERLAARTPSARVVAVGTIDGHALRWHKRSRDGSGKCDAYATGVPGDVVYGVVYELSAPDKIVLDGFEGLGDDYFEKTVAVRTRSGDVLDAIVYVANPAGYDAAARPYAWYKAFVTTGAEQHDFPAAYRAMLDAIDTIEDSDRARHDRETATLRGRRG